MTRRVVDPTRAVAVLRPYDAVTTDQSDVENKPSAQPHTFLKLDSNESTIDPSPLVVERLAAFVRDGGLQWYPDYNATRLRERLAQYTSRAADEVQVFNGSDGALQCIVRTYVDRDDHVVLAAPCYDHLRTFVEATGAEVTYAYSRSLFDTDVDTILEAIGPRTRLVYLANPNNPTGSLYSLADLDRILQRLTNGLLIVDEAYYEFAGLSAASLLDHHAHVIVTRSFSKAFSLAGVRCGYLLASPTVISALSKVRNGKDVGSLAQVAAIAALDDLKYMLHYVKDVTSSREWLAGQVRALGYDVVTTPANFILVATAAPAEFVAELRARGIHVRNRSSLPRMHGYVRITVGTREQCLRVVEAISALTSGVRPAAAVAGAP